MREKNKSIYMLILAMAIFGTIGIFRKFIPLPSATIALTRGAVGAVFLLLFILTVKSYWPAGTHRLQQLLLPQPATVAARQAFSELVTDLENGESFSDSITAFCREVIDHANTQ